MREDDHVLDMREIARKAEETRPKLIIAGGHRLFPRRDWKRFARSPIRSGPTDGRQCAYRRLVAGGAHPSPVPHAHVVTQTTHKSLRGPRGGLILTNDEDIAKKINSAVFPRMQGGPLMHVIAGKAVGLRRGAQAGFQALRPRTSWRMPRRWPPACRRPGSTSSPADGQP